MQNPSRPERAARRAARCASLATAALAAALAFAPWAAAAAGASSTTYIVKDYTGAFARTQPCTGETGTVYIEVNGVFEVVEFTSGPHAGSLWLSGTEAGTFRFVPDDASQPTYEGRYAFHFNVHDEPGADEFTLAFNVHGDGSDGSTVTAHVFAHFTQNGSGTLVAFQHLVCELR